MHRRSRLAAATLALGLCGCPKDPPKRGPEAEMAGALQAALAAEAKVKGRPVPELLSLLAVEDAFGSTRFAATVELADRGSAVVPAMVAGLADPDPAIRSGCATVLGTIRPARPLEAVPALVAALADDGSRFAALWALGEIGPKDEASIAALESARRVEALSSRAAAALDKIHGRAPKDNPD